MLNRTTVKRAIPAPALRFHALIQYRAFSRSLRLALRYLLSGRELDNFTFDIDNREILATFVADTCGLDAKAVRGAMSELDNDAWLRDSIDGVLAGRRDREPHMAYGRRLGWYALTRLTSPRLVVETGVHDGLGSSVFLRAIQRNAEDGVDGRLLSFDVRPDVGWLIPEELRSRHELVIADSVLALPGAVADRQVDLYLHDSLHTYEHESAELESVLALASPGAILMSDNARSGPAMGDFCRRHRLPFALFLDVSVDHFYPGAGIGITRLPGG